MGAPGTKGDLSINPVSKQLLDIQTGVAPPLSPHGDETKKPLHENQSSNPPDRKLYPAYKKMSMNMLFGQ